MAETKKLMQVKAPMSGVFYSKPSPGEAPYVKVGDVVKKKQVIGLLETMKVFQKVKSPVDGTIAQVVAENETPLKDEELMFIIEVA
jgi:acetyl-CoA carboxylase biotin carboxyl carrier protein